MTLTIATINVNGVRAAFRKGMAEWCQETSADIVLLQEVRADEKTAAALFGDEWQVFINASDLKGRAGVAVAVKMSCDWEVDEVLPDTVPVEVPSDGGRWLEVVLSNKSGQQLRVISAYLHSGEINTEKQEHKMAHLARVQQRLEWIAGNLAGSEDKFAVVAGDFNIVRTELDIKNWKPNHNKSAGVLDEEITYLDRWFSSDWVDVGRQYCGNQQGPYSWWSWRGKAFDNDAGWRIDYQMASPALADKVSRYWVERADAYDQRFSDHAPVVAVYEL